MQAVPLLDLVRCRGAKEARQGLSPMKRRTFSLDEDRRPEHMRVPYITIPAPLMPLPPFQAPYKSVMPKVFRSTLGPTLYTAFDTALLCAMCFIAGGGLVVVLEAWLR